MLVNNIKEWHSSVKSEYSLSITCPPHRAQGNPGARDQESIQVPYFAGAGLRQVVRSSPVWTVVFSVSGRILNTLL